MAPGSSRSASGWGCDDRHRRCHDSLSGVRWCSNGVSSGGVSRARCVCRRTCHHDGTDHGARYGGPRIGSQPARDGKADSSTGRSSALGHQRAATRGNAELGRRRNRRHQVDALLTPAPQPYISNSGANAEHSVVRLRQRQWLPRRILGDPAAPTGRQPGLEAAPESQQRSSRSIWSTSIGGRRSA